MKESSIIIEMRERMDQRLMNASEQIWTVPYSFSKSTKEVFNVQKAWHSPNRLSIIITIVFLTKIWYRYIYI
jgi:hypothetical protein